MDHLLEWEEFGDNKKMPHGNFINKKVYRDGSSIIWEVWAQDSDGVSLMQYNSSRNSSKRIKWEVFLKNWKVK